MTVEHVEKARCIRFKKGPSTLKREMKLGSFDADAIITKLDRDVMTRYGVLELASGGERLSVFNRTAQDTEAECKGQFLP